MEFKRDEKGDYVNDATGRPVLDSTLAPATRTRLVAKRGKWLHAPNTEWGSDFWRYARRKSVDFSDGLAESIAARALAPIQDDGRADNIEVETQFTQRGGVAVKATLVDRQKQDEYTVTTPVGI